MESLLCAANSREASVLDKFCRKKRRLTPVMRLYV